MIPGLLSLLVLTQVPEIRSLAADRTEMGITLYHAGYAMVRERRRVHLPAGTFRLALVDVAESLEPKTVQFRILSGAPVNVQERNFESDLLSPENIVKQSLGAKVWIPNLLAGGPPVEGKLASRPTLDIYAPPRTPLEARLDPMPALERYARIHRGRFAKRRLVERDPDVMVHLPGGFVPASPTELTFASRPRDLRPSPTLLMDLSSASPGQRSLDLAYLAKGLHWNATYIATLRQDASAMDLDAFVTLSNETGSAFPRASLQLLAGAPNRVPDLEPDPIDPDAPRFATVEVCASASVDPFKTERIGDNQLFTLDRPTSVAAGQTKQIALFSAVGIPIQRENIMGIAVRDWLDRNPLAKLKETDPVSPSTGWSPFDNMQTRIRFFNHRRNQLGRPLPQGNIHVQYLHRQGQPIPLSEEWFEETPEGEYAEFSLGPIAGLSGRWRLAEITRGGWFRLDSRQATVELIIVNSRARAERAEIHALLGADWEVLSATHSGTRENSELAVFRVPAATGETKFRATFLIPDPKP